MKELNWLEDSPLIPFSPSGEHVYIPLSETREFLKDFDDASIKQIAIKLKEYLVDKAGIESFTFKTLFGDYKFRNGVQFFLFDILSSTYIPFSRTEIIARKEGRATNFDMNEETRNRLPPPFDDLTFYEILSILILEAAFDGRSMEAMYGIYTLINFQLKFKESYIESMEDQYQPAMRAWEIEKKRTEKMLINSTRRKMYTQIRDSVIRLRVDRLRKDGALIHKEKKSETANYLLNHCQEFVCKKEEDMKALLIAKRNGNPNLEPLLEEIDLLSVDQISRILN